MSDWKKYYDDHLVSIKEAAAKIEPGDTLYLGQTIIVPTAFIDELAERHEELHDITMLTNMCVAPNSILFDPVYKKSFHFISFFPNVLERMSADLNIADVNPTPYDRLVESVTDVYKANVCGMEICPPDEDGYCNVGVLGTALTPNIFRHDGVKKRFAFINKFQPRANGTDSVTKIHITQFDYICEDHHEISGFTPAEPTEYDKLIAAQIKPYINDGDTIQIGMGGLGNQIALDLMDKKDLHIFTEIITDSMIDLVEAGVAKDIRGGGAFGTKELYIWMGERSDVITLMDYRDIIHPDAVASVDNIVAINTTFMVDLTGQACSEAQGIKQYSGVGGSFSFLSGAPKAKNGRSFLCLRSTYTDKAGVSHSNIVAALPEGSIVTTPRYIPQYIVTEYGVANVYLKSIKDRINALLKIAHPEFKDELKQKCIELGLMGEDDFRD